MKRELLFLMAMVLLKWIVAARLELFGDEAFYWQCAQHPALVYSDLPLATSLLVKGGTFLLGDQVLGVRLFFLLCGMLLPLAVYHLAKPYTGARRAVYAAVLTVIFPNLGLLGLNAVPDTPLLLLCTLFTLAVSRGTRRQGMTPWILAGLMGSLGLVTHYRFVILLMATVVYVVFSRNRRKHIRGMLLTGLLCLPGLLPPLLYNLAHSFAPLRYFLSVRHSGGIHLDQLPHHLGEQMAMVTPILYGLCVVMGLVILRKLRKGNDCALFFFVFAVFPLGFYLLASPFHGTGPMTVHWPIFGYIPLLVWLPSLLNNLYQRGRACRVFALIGPGFAVVVLILALVELGFHPFGISGINRPFAGWNEAGNHVRRHMQAQKPTALIAGDYLLGSNLDFQFKGRLPLYILNHSKNYEHGRQLQFDQWNMGEQSMAQHSGSTVLFVMNARHITDEGTEHWREHLNNVFSSRQLLETITVGKGRYERRFSFYLAQLQDR